MGKRQQQAQETKEKIMAAAKRIIGQKGSVTVDEIVAEAGVAKGSFYTHFARKEDVVNALAARSFDRMEAEAGRIEGGAAVQLEYFLAHSMRYIEEMGIRMCQEWLKNAVDSGQDQGRTKLNFDLNVIRTILKQAVAAGELQQGTPVEELTERIAAQYYGIVVCWGILDGRMDALAQVKTYCREDLGPGLARWQRPT